MQIECSPGFCITVHVLVLGWVQGLFCHSFGDKNPTCVRFVWSKLCIFLNFLRLSMSDGFLFSLLLFMCFCFLFLCVNTLSSSLLSDCSSPLSVCCCVYLYLPNLFFPSWLFLSFSSFASCCSCHSQHQYCYYCHCWDSRGPWGPSSGGPWLPQPQPCFS